MAQDEETSWQYNPDGDAQPGGDGDVDDSAPVTHDRPAHTPKHVEWESLEFIDHHHGAGWFFLLFVTTIVFATLIYLLSKDTVAVITVVLVGIIIGVFATQKPSKAKYEISSSGMKINGKLYRYSNYKSFTIIQEGELMSVNLSPLKRLTPVLSAYFNSDKQNSILKALGNYLPYEEKGLDGIERLSRRLRL
jgi:hypothetical protein